MFSDMRRKYQGPRIIREVRPEYEEAFLLGSIVDNVSSVESTGQEVQEYNFAEDSQFNHVWE